MAHNAKDSFNDAARTNTGLLVQAERRVLNYLVERLPDWVNADHLTALALGSMLMAGIAYAASGRVPSALVWAVVALAVNWFGDSLDGTLARLRRQLRPRYGFYIDHLFDSFGVLFVLGGLALSGRMTPLIAAAVTISYFLLSIETYLATYCVGRFELSHWGLGPTELRIVLAIGTLVLLVKPLVTIAGRSFPLFDVGGIAAAVGMTITATIAATRHIIALYRAEPLTPRVPLQVLDHLADDILRVTEEH